MGPWGRSTGDFTPRAVQATSEATSVRIAPDVPPRSKPPVVADRGLPPSWDLDGTYLWLGPVGAASHVQGQWDSTIGADATLVRVREHEVLGALGASFGGSRWTARGGGRLWLDMLAGTELGGHMFGMTAGPLVELSDEAHPRVGGSFGLWAFFGVAPFVRIGAVPGLGGFAEIGLHLTLPVLRRRH